MNVPSTRIGQEDRTLVKSDIIGLISSGILLLGNYIGGNTVWCCVHKHDHRDYSSSEQGECHAARKKISQSVSLWAR